MTTAGVSIGYRSIYCIYTTLLDVSSNGLINESLLDQNWLGVGAGAAVIAVLAKEWIFRSKCVRPVFKSCFK